MTAMVYCNQSGWRELSQPNVHVHRYVIGYTMEVMDNMFYYIIIIIY